MAKKFKWTPEKIETMLANILEKDDTIAFLCGATRGQVVYMRLKLGHVKGRGFWSAE